MSTPIEDTVIGYTIKLMKYMVDLNLLLKDAYTMVAPMMDTYLLAGSRT